MQLLRGATTQSDTLRPFSIALRENTSLVICTRNSVLAIVWELTLHTKLFLSLAIYIRCYDTYFFNAI